MKRATTALLTGWLLCGLALAAPAVQADPESAAESTTEGRTLSPVDGKPAGGAGDIKPPQVKEVKPPPAKIDGNTGPKAGEVPAVEPAGVDPDDEAAAEQADAARAALALPASPDPVQVFGWRELVAVNGVSGKFHAKLDTGALTSSIHAEEREGFERDGKKWVRFIVTDPTKKDSPRTRIEAPLVRIAKIKEPGGAPVSREVVRLAIQIGDRKLKANFTLNNRTNMLSPILIGRSTIQELGWVDSSRTYIAEKKVFR